MNQICRNNMEDSSKTPKKCSRLSCVMNQDPEKYCDSYKINECITKKNHTKSKGRFR